MRLPRSGLPVSEHGPVVPVEGPQDDVCDPGLLKRGKRERRGSRVERVEVEKRESVEGRQSVSSSLSFPLFFFFFLSLLFSLFLSSDSAHLVDVLLRRVRAEDGVEGKLSSKTRESERQRFQSQGQGKSERGDALLALCFFRSQNASFSSVSFLTPLTWLSPEPSPRSMTTRCFFRGV